jgi:hypothetical protein
VGCALAAERIGGVQTMGGKRSPLDAHKPWLEELIAKLKVHLRKAGERSIPALWDRIGTILQTFTPEECNYYFTHAGYGSN